MPGQSACLPLEEVRRLGREYLTVIRIAVRTTAMSAGPSSYKGTLKCMSEAKRSLLRQECFGLRDVGIKPKPDMLEPSSLEEDNIDPRSIGRTGRYFDWLVKQLNVQRSLQLFRDKDIEARRRKQDIRRLSIFYMLAICNDCISWVAYTSALVRTLQEFIIGHKLIKPSALPG